jgi:hypothetical protein
MVCRSINATSTAHQNKHGEIAVSGGFVTPAFPSEVPTPGRTPHGFASIFFFDLGFSANLSNRF